MNSEARLILELWESVRDTIPAPKRGEIAMLWLRSFEEYSFSKEDLADLVGEDKHLEEAFNILFGEDDDNVDDLDSEYED